MFLLCPILHETFLPLTAKITLIIIFCNLYMPYKSCAVLCMLDAVFGFEVVFISPRSLFCEQVFKWIINDCYFNFLCLNFPRSKFSWFALIFYQFQLLCSYKVYAYKKLHNLVFSYSGTQFFISNYLGLTLKNSPAQKMKFSIKDFSSKCEQICRKLRIWPHLLKKPLLKNVIFCAVVEKKMIEN